MQESDQKHTIKQNSTYLKVQNYGPYQPQSQFGIPICYVIISNVNQFHLPWQKENTEKIETHVTNAGCITQMQL